MNQIDGPPVERALARAVIRERFEERIAKDFPAMRRQERKRIANELLRKHYGEIVRNARAEQTRLDALGPWARRWHRLLARVRRLIGK